MSEPENAQLPGDTEDTWTWVRGSGTPGLEARPGASAEALSGLVELYELTRCGCEVTALIHEPECNEPFREDVEAVATALGVRARVSTEKDDRGW